MGYIFYDTETTGLEEGYDQILQFAGIATDDSLNEISTINIRSRLLPYIIPAPGALLVTKVRPKDLHSSQYSHLEMVYEILKWIRKYSPCQIMGHNSIEFDEKFLRHAFYRTLHPIYLTNTEGNYRGDIMRIAQAISIFAPGSINVPISDKNKSSFKLGELARANGITFTDEEAHDALADVRATLNLARLLKEKAPAIFDQMLENGMKQKALDFVVSNPSFCFADVYFGNPVTRLYTMLALNPKYDAEVAVFDLSYDPAEYLNCSVEDIIAVIDGKTKKLHRAIRIVKINGQPMIMDNNIGKSFIDKLPFSQEVVDERCRQLQAATEFRQRVAVATGIRFDDKYGNKEPSPHIEEKIYDGFPSHDDRKLMEQFHQVPWEEKIPICEKFTDKRFSELAYRLLYAEKPEIMPDNTRIIVEQHFKERLLTGDHSVPWMTIPKAMKEGKDLWLQGGDKKLLTEIEVFLIDMSARIGNVA